MCVRNERGNVSNYILPFLSHIICQNVWIELLFLSKSPFYTWWTAIGPSRNILFSDHALIGQVSNNYKTTTRDAVSDYIETIAERDGHLIAIHVCRADGSFSDPYIDTENVSVLPPKNNSSRFMFHVYTKQTVYEECNVSLMSFSEIMKTNVHTSVCHSGHEASVILVSYIVRACRRSQRSIWRVKQKSGWSIWNQHENDNRYREIHNEELWPFSEILLFFWRLHQFLMTLHPKWTWKWWNRKR